MRQTAPEISPTEPKVERSHGRKIGLLNGRLKEAGHTRMKNRQESWHLHLKPQTAYTRQCRLWKRLHGWLYGLLHRWLGCGLQIPTQRGFRTLFGFVSSLLSAYKYLQCSSAVWQRIFNTNLGQKNVHQMSMKNVENDLTAGTQMCVLRLCRKSIRSLWI